MKNSGLITKTINTPTASSASGVWSLQEQYEAETNNAWPKYVGSGTPTNGLLIHLDPANYTSGTTFADISGNGWDMTLSGSPTHNTTNGGTFTFTTSQYMQTATYGGNLNRQYLDYTVIYAARINSTTVNRTRVLASPANNWALGFWDGYYDSYYANSWVYQPSTRDTNWRIFSATRNHSADLDNLYSNGVPLVTDSNSGTRGFIGLGVNKNLYNHTSDCEVGILLVYDRALTSYEVIQVYNTYKTRYGLT